MARSNPKQLRETIQKLSPEEAMAVLYDWSIWARPNQLPPDSEWYIWLLLSGRGGGKTRVGSETVIRWAREHFSPIALVGRTKADIRDTMVETGESSILACSPPWFRPRYEPTKRHLIWPNGVLGITYSGDEPDQLRGPQHAKAWVDELAKFENPMGTWDNLMMGLRVGSKPQVIVTSTPRPIPIIKMLEKDPQAVIVRSHTMENKDNLSGSFLRFILSRYEGTRLGRQELAGETLSDNPDALWKRDELDAHRMHQCPPLFAVVTAIDPAVSNTEASDETGIITAGIGYVDGDIHGFVLEDRSLRGTPNQWGTASIASYSKNKADRIVGEANNGGDMVESTIKTIDITVNFKKVYATRGKYTRAEPVSALYEQGKVHHVGFFPELEDQLCEWVPGEKSPDRLDALVWALTELMLSGSSAAAWNEAFEILRKRDLSPEELEELEKNELKKVKKENTAS